MSQAAKHASPRQVALALMAGVLDEGRLLSDLVATPMVTELAPGDRARAARLATETLRTLDRADRLLKPLLRKEPPLMVQNILRLGVVEICGNGEAAHGVVNDLVGIAGASNRTQPYKGMVNAVLRRAGEAGEGKWGKMPVPRLPKWLRQPLMA
ncbi:MAG: transcription antitermination factor NusB, partial [Pseudomonadota bacterium]